MLESLEEDLTCSHVKEIDSALVGAAISYFGNWGAAIRAAGLDYYEIRKISKERRSGKVRKWTIEKVLEDIKKVAESEDDLSYAYIKEKHSSLVAAANNYIGSWKKALELCGLDYNEILKTGRKKRMEREVAWYRELLLERLDNMEAIDENSVRNAEPVFHEMLMKHFPDWRNTIVALKDWRSRKERESN